MKLRDLFCSALVCSLFTVTITVGCGILCAADNPLQTEQIPVKVPVAAASLRPPTRPSPMPLAERIRRGVIPKRGLVSTGVDGGTFISGDGKMSVDVSGFPLTEQVSFGLDSLVQPWKMPFEAPKIAQVLPEVRKLIMEGRYREGLELSLEAFTDAGMPPGTRSIHGGVSPFSMRIEIPQAGTPKDFLRTLDFESGEVKVLWTDDRGQWVRQTFVSRPDNVVVQYLTPPKGQTLNATIAVNTDFGGFGGRGGRGTAGGPGGDVGAVQYERDFNERRLIVTGHYSPDLSKGGFGGVTRVVPVGGSVRMENGNLVVTGAQSVLLLSRTESYPDYDRAKVDALAHAVDQIAPDYATLVARHRKVQAEMMDRVSVDFGGSSQTGLSSEELLADQRTHIGYAPALLEQIFDMGRYWLMAQGTGDYPSIAGHLNINVNLQISPAAMGNLPEAIKTFTKWIEQVTPDARTNAKNIFGFRGALFSVHPDQQQGVSSHCSYTWPHHYWISAGGWAYSPIWDYYLTSGDRDFLRDHIVPGLKEIALFYEDYLTLTDERGNYIFVPSYSPENWPSNADGAPTVINAVMDIAVCKEVLTHLIQASEILGTDAASMPKWKAMLAKMPPYLLDTDGALKEWAWPTLEERLDHRHPSHLYGAWPGDEITPDRTPELATATWLADRKRAQENAAGHGLSHRGLAAARLKDDYLVNMELKQFFEQGYVGPTLRTSHNPYTEPMPDQQGSIPTLMMEMLVYSRPGVIELLPAVPATLTKGSIKGVLARTFAKVDDLTWNMGTRTVDVTISSLRDQDISLVVRHGIESITAPAGVLAAQPKPDATTCQLHLTQNKPATLHLKVGSHKPSDWIQKVASR